MAKKASGVPHECAACGATDFSRNGNVYVCENAMCPAVGRLEYHGPKKGLADDKVGWQLDGRKVKSILDIYGDYPPSQDDFMENDPEDAEPGEENDGFVSKWGEFSVNLSSKFLFPDEDNHDIERRLQKAGVIAKDAKTDSEMGEMHVFFDSKQEADAFYVRLWNYLRKRWLSVYSRPQEATARTAVS